MPLFIGDERQFNGVYVAHWEVARFEMISGRWLFGLFEKTDRCQLETAEGVEPIISKLFDGIEPVNWRRSPGIRFAMSFDGRVIESGKYGHKGLCRWRVLVRRWLAVKRLCADSDTTSPCGGA